MTDREKLIDIFDKVLKRQTERGFSDEGKYIVDDETGIIDIGTELITVMFEFDEYDNIFEITVRD